MVWNPELGSVSPTPLPFADVEEREISMDLRPVLAASYTCRGPKGAFDIGGCGERGGFSSPTGPGVQQRLLLRGGSLRNQRSWYGEPCVAPPNCWWSPTFNQIV